MNFFHLFLAALALAVLFTVSVAFDDRSSTSRRTPLLRLIVVAPIFVLVATIAIFVVMALLIGGVSGVASGSQDIAAFRVCHGLYSPPTQETLLGISILLGAVAVFVSARLQIRHGNFTPSVRYSAGLGITLIAAPFAVWGLGDWYELLSLAFATVLLLGAWRLWNSDRAVATLLAVASVPCLFITLLTNQPTDFNWALCS